MPKAKKYAYLKEIEIKYRLKKTRSKIIGSSVSGAKTIAQLFSDLQNEGKEKFITVNLSAANKIVCFEVVAIGSVDMVYLRPGEAFRSSVMVNAYATIVVHNHPSGETKPSNGDIVFTDQLQKAAQILGIKLYDHIIIGSGKRYYSFADHGKMVHTIDPGVIQLKEFIKKEI